VAHARGGFERTPATPIQHVVVIFQENVSFDHYFGTYPHAANPPGEPRFVARVDTPSINGLTDALQTANPDLASRQRLDRDDGLVCDQNHDYDPEQRAWDGGLLDRFVQETSGSITTTGVTGPDCVTPLPDHRGDQATNKLVMDYYDGNTVTALWNYAQHFTLLDNSFGTTFGPSTVGALNLVSGNTAHAIVPAGSTASSVTAGTITTTADVRDGVVIGDPDPAFDDCSSTKVVRMTGVNVGDLLTARHVTWGWFEGGFRPSSRDAGGKAICQSAHKNIGGTQVTDYSAHHEPFQYYAATANPHHLAPSSVAMIGHDDRAHHQYDLTDFFAALAAHHMPAVSFLKAPKYQDGHPGYSDPLDEQHFLVDTINRLERAPEWGSMAIIIAYDDSDGWYDHVAGPIVNQSSDVPSDRCGTTPVGQPSDRCGYGPRLPMLVISPFARANYVDHQLTDQTSILRFIEDNWRLGRIGGGSFDRLAGSLGDAFAFGRPANRPLRLNPITGEPVGS
jgi:phospholipase C